MEIDINQLSALAQRHHLVEIVGLATVAWRMVRPLQVDIRAFLVESIAVGRAVAKKQCALSDADIDAERPAARRAIPDVPEDTGVGQKILGIIPIGRGR